MLQELISSSFHFSWCLATRSGSQEETATVGILSVTVCECRSWSSSIHGSDQCYNSQPTVWDLWLWRLEALWALLVTWACPFSSRDLSSFLSLFGIGSSLLFSSASAAFLSGDLPSLELFCCFFNSQMASYPTPTMIQSPPGLPELPTSARSTWEQGTCYCYWGHFAVSVFPSQLLPSCHLHYWE